MADELAPSLKIIAEIKAAREAGIEPDEETLMETERKVLIQKLNSQAVYSAMVSAS